MAQKKTPSEELEVSVKVHRYPGTTLFFRNAVGDGTLGEHTVEFSQNMSGEPIVRIGHGPWYLFDIHSMIEACAHLDGLTESEAQIE